MSKKKKKTSLQEQDKRNTLKKIEKKVNTLQLYAVIVRLEEKRKM